MGVTREGTSMDLAPLVRAVEVLTSPLEWGGRQAWLAESHLRVRDACGAAASISRAMPWISSRRCYTSPRTSRVGFVPRWSRSMPGVGALVPCRPSRDASEPIVRVVSLRCALGAGLSALHRIAMWRGTLGQAFDDVETGMVIYGSTGDEVTRNARLDELLSEEPARDRLRELLARHARLIAASTSPHGMRHGRSSWPEVSIGWSRVAPLREHCFPRLPSSS